MDQDTRLVVHLVKVYDIIINMRERVKHNLKPIYNKDSKVLILGSLPSKVSREEKFYYANKTNRFWCVMEKIFNERLETNCDKEAFLLRNKIALWDTIKSCDISSSSDSSITNVIVNDIDSLIKKSSIKVIFCSGKKSYELFNKYIKVTIPVIYLPSTSSANASFSLEKLVNEYSIILDYLD